MASAKDMAVHCSSASSAFDPPGVHLQALSIRSDELGCCQQELLLG
jgi:hypothetical protein